MTFIIRAFALALFLLPAAAQAGDVSVVDAWARATAGKAKNGGCFMTLKNAGHGADKLIAAKADVAERTELHTHVMEGNVMRMRQVPHMEVPAMGSTVLQPGGLHVMFLGLHKPLKEGETFPLTLTFEKAGAMTVDVTVKSVGAMDSGHMGHGSDMKSMDKPMDGAGQGHMHGKMN